MPLDSCEKLKTKITKQENKISIKAECFKNTRSQKKHIGKEAKARIYNITIKPIITYTAETELNTAKTWRQQKYRLYVIIKTSRYKKKPES